MRPQSTRGANRVIARPRSAAAKSERKLKARSDKRYIEEEATCSHESHAQKRGYADPNRDMDDYHRNSYYQ